METKVVITLTTSQFLLLAEAFGYAEGFLENAGQEVKAQKFKDLAEEVRANARCI